MTGFTKSRERLLEGAIAAKFLRAVPAQPEVEALLSDEHISVDGTLIQAPPAPPGAGSLGHGSARLLRADGPA